MSQELDRWMERYGVEALLVFGGTADNASMRYLVSRGRLSQGVLLKKRGHPARVWVSPMEREEAALSGLEVFTWNQAGWSQWLQQAQGNRQRAWVLLVAHLLRQEGLDQARVAVAGRVELGPHWSLLQQLQQEFPRLVLLGQEGHQALQQARARKSPEEIERIRRMGQRTVEVVGRLWEWLRSRRLQQGVLMDGDRPVTIGQVKTLLRQWVLEQDADLPYGLIFAQGRDAGIPHSMGQPNQVLRAGMPIVFDIFPREGDHGYFYDFTRTWVLGYADDRVQELYHQVLEAHHLGLEHTRVGVPAHHPYDAVCDYLETRGHPTLRTQPDTQEGFVHSLGHGLGLDIHESPVLRQGMKELLEPGMVVTVEPGLYYPEQHMGFRVEDTVVLTPEGHAQVLAEFPYDLVIPVA